MLLEAGLSVGLRTGPMRKKKPKLLATRRQHVRRNGARPVQGVAVQCFIDGDLSNTSTPFGPAFLLLSGAKSFKKTKGEAFGTDWQAQGQDLHGKRCTGRWACVRETDDLGVGSSLCQKKSGVERRRRISQ